MILTKNKIKKSVKNGDIKITPFDTNNLSTNSYDLRLGDTLLVYEEDVLDPTKNNRFRTITIPKEGITLEKGSFHLGSSYEIIGSNKFVPIIHAKSGIARMGLFVHCTADLIDIGSFGNVTFQLYSTLPIKVYPGMLIGQVTFWVPSGDINLYSGKYQGSEGPQASKSYID
jgi:dCTP deaminase